MTSADNVFIDSLPYYDDDLAQHPNLQALVDAEIARELKAKPPPNPATDPRLPPERPLFKVRHFTLSCFYLAIFCSFTAWVILQLDDPRMHGSSRSSQSIHSLAFRIHLLVVLFGLTLTSFFPTSQFCLPSHPSTQIWDPRKSPLFRIPHPIIG